MKIIPYHRKFAITTVFFLILASCMLVNQLVQSQVELEAYNVSEYNFYIRIGDIDGDYNLDIGESSPILAYQFSGISKSTVTGSKSGYVAFTSFVVLKLMDKTTPEVFDAFISQTIFQDVYVLQYTRVEGISQLEFRYQLKTAMIRSYTVTGQNNLEDEKFGKIETIEFIFNELCIYTLGSGPETCYTGGK